MAAEVLDIPDEGDSSSWLEACARTHNVLVAAGGDGTVSTVAAAAAKTGAMLGVIPSGTLNHFAKDVGVPANMTGAVAALASTRVRLVDVGRVNGHAFLNNVSLGNYPRMVHEREALEEDGRSHALATTVAAARTWWGLRNMAAVIVADGRLGVLMLPLRALVGALERDDIEKNVPMKTDSIFRIASMSKPFASVAIMMLYEENKLFLTDPVSKFIPAFKNVQVFEPDLLKRLPCKCMISAWLSKPSPSTWKPTRPCRATSEAASRSRMSSRSGSALR